MNKETKINAILSIVANKDPECDIFEFVELDKNNNEIKREVVKRPAIGRVGSRLEIGARSEYYENTKINILKLREKLAKE